VAEIPSLWVFPLDGLIALTGASGAASPRTVPAALRPEGRGGAGDRALVITNPRAPLFQDRPNQIEFLFSLKSALHHIHIGHEPRTRDKVALVSSEIQVVDRRSRTPVTAPARVTVTPPLLQA